MSQKSLDTINNLIDNISESEEKKQDNNTSENEYKILDINNDSKIHLTLNFINNQYIKPTDGKYFDNINPATNKIISKVPASTKKDVDLAVDSAFNAFNSWKKLTVQQRSKYLLDIANEIESRLDEFAMLESRDNGKPFKLAKMVDIPRAVSNFRFFATQIIHDYTNCHQMNDAINYTYRKPLGVCSLITPWNLPLYLLTWKIAPAIACGNTVVCKPSELTPMTAHLLTDCILKAKLPKGVINIIHGFGKDAGEPLCINPKVNGISFTGGTITGQRISQVAAPLFKKISLELGGKNATVICDDCDFDITVIGAVRAAFANQGQICLCGSRIFVQDTIYNKFLTKFIELTKKVYSTKIGNPLTSGYGSLISQNHLKKVISYVEWAKNNGGTIELGGNKPKLDKPFNNGAFYEPTIITNLDYKCKCAQEEIFGPVVTIHKFKNDNEVIDMCNSVQYGLAGSVWTNNIKRGHIIAQEIDSGMIWVNCWLYRDLRVPFGGVKQSGTGREGGMHSLDFWSEIKNICIKL